ncbi:MAG: hypothetical protein OXE50_02150 [Chloroflexi bacterium]|nr:hypothetical protein [Chloroflexota bacterium]
MGVDIGIMKVEYLPRPRGVVYDFASEMAAGGALDAYMFGEGNSWIPFTQRQVLRMLDAFTRERGLSPQERLEIRAWLASLPWIGGWQDALPPGDGRDQEIDYYPVVDNDDGRDGGIIELHFNW